MNWQCIAAKWQVAKVEKGAESSYYVPMVRPRIRRIEEVIDLQSMACIPADALLNFDFGRQVRKSADYRKSTNEPLVCRACDNPIIVPMHWRTREYHFKHVGKDVDCPWTSESSLSVDDVSRRIFRGQQEGRLHKFLKEVVAKLLALDPGASEIAVEQRHKSESQKASRQPDIRFRYRDRQFVIEIQLATTQRPIISARNSYYLKEGIYPIWVVWNPPDIEIAAHKASVIDVITDHNDNLFSLDPETIRESKSSCKFLLRVRWWANGCHSRIVSLDDLILPVEGLPFVVPREVPWHEQWKNDWISITPPQGSEWKDRRSRWPALIERLECDVTDTSLELEFELVALISLLLSFERNQIIGSRQKSLTEMLHTFLTTKGRQPLARIVERAAELSGHSTLFERKRTAELLADAKSTPQKGKASLEANVVRLLFPQWVGPTAV